MSKSSRCTLSYISLDSTLNSSLVHLPISLYAPLTQRSVPPQNIVVELELVLPPSSNGGLHDSVTDSEPESESEEGIQSDRKYYVGWSGMSSTPLSNSSIQSQSQSSTSSSPSLQTVLTIAPSLASLLRPLSSTISLESCLVKITLLRSPPLPTAQKIEVTPLTPDDWEILSLHAEQIEANMLGQVRAARKGMKIIVSTGSNGRTRCTFRVDSTDPPTASSSHSPDSSSLARAVRLSTDTEVIIAPKLRSLPNPQDTESHSLNSINGTKPPASSQEQQQMIEIQSRLKRMLWRVLPLEWEPCNLQLRDGNQLPSGVVLPPSRREEGNDPYGFLMKAFPTGRFSVTKVPCPATSGSSFSSTSQSRKSFKRDDLDDEEKDSKGDLDQETEQGEENGEDEEEQLGVGNQSSLPRRPTASAQFSASLSLVRDGENESHTAGKEVLWPERHVWLDLKLRKALGIGPGELVRFTSPPPFSSQQVSEPESNSKSKVSSKSKSKGPSLAGVDSLLECSTSLILDTFRARTLLDVDSAESPRNGNQGGKGSSIRSGSSGMLLVGGPGSGKTSVCDSISFRLTDSTLSKKVGSTGSSLPPIKTIKISCSPFSEERLPILRNRISSWLLECSWNSPTLLILEDLDRLCPAEQEHSDSTRSKQISENLISALKECIEKDDVFVVITCQNENSLHERIRNSKVINRIMKLKPPSKEGRKEILELVVKEKCGWKKEDGQKESGSRKMKGNGIQPRDLNYVTLAGLTEGYLPRDLKDLTDRAVHQAVMRSAGDRANGNREDEQDEDEKESENEADSPLYLLPADFVSAQEGFTPLSLRDISLAESTVAWSDIGGLQSTRRVLRETLEWPTKYSAIFQNCPLRLRSGLLLYGYPGCGKTLLASAVAKECGLNFISVKGPEILNKYIGASEKSVRDLFDRAQAAKPCVLFFDEFDSIAPKRGHDSTGVTDRVVNQLLTQMDGAEGLDGVYVLAATSRPDLIDAALLRPGRLDKSLLCDMPNLEDRLDIMKAVAPKINLGKEVDLKKWAEKTEGFSGADLQALLYNANLETIHQSIEQVKKNEDENSKKDSANSKEKKTQFLKLGGGRKSEKVDRKGKGKAKDNSSGLVSSNSTAMSGAEKQALQRKLDLMLENFSTASNSQNSNLKAASDLASSKPDTFVTDAHIENSLLSTRPSVPAEEVVRLRKIYREFAGDERDGGFPNGEGSKDVGARETLM